MEKATNKRIAIFLANWEWISVLSNMVKMLSEHGYEVDVFHSRNYLFVDPNSMRQWPGVRIHDFSPGDGASASQGANHTGNGFQHGLKRFVPAGVRDALREIRHASRHLCGSEKGLLDPTLVPRTLALMNGRGYKCLIGIEKSGLVWAGQVADKLRLPFLYFSLELYTDEYVRLGLKTSFLFKHSRWGERKYHRKAAATIVQDVERARVLLDSNGVSMTDATIAYLPVSILGSPCARRSSFLHETLGIPRERKIILYFGHIRERRYALEVARVAQEGPEDWVFVMHGPCEEDTIEKIERINVNKRVVLSLKTVPSEMIQEVISSADIGLAMYSPLTQNERLTAFSSEKMALYMQCGVPFIAFDYPGYERLAKEDRCGVVIKNMTELPEAVSTILGAHEEFREAAYQTFSKYYDFAANFSDVSRTIELLSNGFAQN